MKPWSERDISQFEVQPQLDQELKNVTGLQTAVFPRPSLPGSGGGLPFQFVITTGEDYERLNDVANDLLDRKSVV